MAQVPATPAAPGVGMSAASAETWVIVSALVVGGVYVYRRVTEPTTVAKGSVANIAGIGTPVNTGQFVTAWGLTFLIVSIMAQADPGLGGGFALLIMASSLLTNAQSVFSDALSAVSPQTANSPTNRSGVAVGTPIVSASTAARNAVPLPAPYPTK